jgi:hypothetical protein
MLANIAAIFTASGLMNYRLYYGNAGLLPATIILLAASLFSILISQQFLPIQPVTKAEFQTQPALIAYWKNALLYFFPLGIMFVLLPLYTVNTKRLIEIQIINEMPSDFIFIKPGWLLLICLCLMFFSFAATNYLMDRLNTESSHYPLYTGLILLRMFIYFGLAVSATAWYYAKIKR